MSGGLDLDGVKQAAGALAEALDTVEGLAVYTNLAARLSPPAAMVGAPELAWDAYGLEPSSARFPVFVVVKADDYAMTRLWELVAQVSAAVDQHLDSAAVTGAVPFVYNGAGADLPAYQITVECGL